MDMDKGCPEPLVAYKSLGTANSFKESMEYSPVTRPEPSEKKIRTSEDFELCYLRHQYFRRVKYNPTEAEMLPYMKIVENLTKKTFFTYQNLFKAVGMYHDDIVNVGRVHLVSFLGLYALESNDNKKKRFSVHYEIDHQVPAKTRDFDQKNKANFTCFFKQRMEDLVRVCRQKVRNIKGQSSEEFVVFSGKANPPKYHTKLLKNAEKFGYKKIDLSVFKSIRKKADVNNDASIFKFGGVWYVAIQLEQRGLEIEDLVGSESNPYENDHNMRPDELFENSPIKGFSWNMSLTDHKKKSHKVVKEDRDSEHFKKLFGKKSNYRKRVTLQNFIAKNKNMSQYREEIKLAKRMLKDLGGWIR